MDLSRLKTNLKRLTLQGVKKLSAPIGDGKRSSYQIISIAGETIALSETGLEPTEKVLHNKDDFERLYVPESIREKQSDLEEILIRMFPLTSLQTKQDILPPDDPEEFNLVRTSLTFRLQTLQEDILSDTSDSVGIREKLSRFDRLKKLLDSLEKNFQKKRRFTYRAITTASSGPPSKEPKIEMTEEDVNALLHQFGLVLLQAQHQLPGFQFKTSPNQIVREVQTIALENEEDFLQAAAAEKEIQTSIQDVLNPEEKEARILDTLQEKMVGLVGTLGEALSPEAIGKLDIDIQGKSFEQGITDLLTSLFAVVEEYETTVDTIERVIDNMEEEKEVLNERMANLSKELKECNKKLGTPSESPQEEDDSEQEALKQEKATLEKEKQALQAQITTLQAQLVDKQTFKLQRDEAVKKLRVARDEMEQLRQDMRKKDETIARLQEAEGKIGSLQAKIEELEAAEQLSKDQKAELDAKTSELQKLSSQKTQLEEQLAEYDENLNEIQKLVSSIPLPAASGSSPFEQLKSRILSILPPTEDLSSFPSLTLNLPSATVPTVLESEASIKAYYCEFMEKLAELYSQYFDSEEGQAFETKLTAVLDKVNETSTPKFTVKVLYNAILYARGNLDPKFESTFDMIDLASNEEINALAPEAEAFLKDDPQINRLQTLNKILDEKNLPSYATLFFLYLVALRDWVNCVVINSSQVKCPEIPMRLRREIQCQ